MIVKNTNEEYHSGEGVSKSDLDLIHSCPEKYRYKQDHPGQDQTPALLFGSAVHKLILEPNTFNKEYAVFADYDKRTKNGKEMYKKFLDRLNGRKEITESDLMVMQTMRDVVMSHPKARMLLTGGKTETSYYWIDPRTGTLCKCRPDKVNRGYIIDLKTTSDASPEGFEKSMMKYRYHVQAAWYLRGYEAATGIKPEGFIFIAVEKNPPYSVAVYLCDDLSIEIGAREADEDLDVFVKCSEIGKWHGYGGEKDLILPIGLPDYILRKEI